MDLTVLVLLLTACVANAAVLPQELAFWQLGEMIRCYQPGVNPFKFNDYGCWCGIGGSGAPVDQLDRCCQVHDHCYKACRTSPNCTPIINVPYIEIYHFTCNNKQATCPASNSKCQDCVCSCDRAAGSCFAKAPYNPAYKNMNQRRCSQG